MDSITKIEKIQALINKKEENIKELQYEIELLNNDAAFVVNSIGKDNGLYYYLIPRIEGTIKWLHKRNSVDKRLKDDDKDDYHMLIAMLTSWVGESVKDITEIVQCGYDCYAYGIEFILSTDAEHTYRLDVPNYGHVEPKHLCDVKWGLLSLYKGEPHENGNVNYWRRVWCDYNTDSLKEDFKCLRKEKDADQ